MRLIMGIVVAAMGAAIMHHAPVMGFIQIWLGAVLTWVGVRHEIAKADVVDHTHGED